MPLMPWQYYKIRKEPIQQKKEFTKYTFNVINGKVAKS